MADHSAVQCEFSRILPQIYEKVPEGNITLKEFLNIMGKPGKLIISLLLAAPFLIPISIPGTGIIAGFIIFTLVISIIFDRDLIPKSFQNRKISNKNLIRALDITFQFMNFLGKFVKPRFLAMTRGAVTPRVNKFFLLLSSLLFMFPLPVPLTDTLPALGVFLLSAGTLECDGYLILAGYFVVILNIIYFGSIVLLGLAGISYLGINFS